jgi:hypothetical protein
MKGEQPIISRRQETICGKTITIITRGEIETVRGAPKCRWCGKPLRPNYDTQRTAVERRHYFSKQPHGATVFDEKRGQWVVVSTSYPVVRRVFLGSFGMYKDNHFCGLNCGRDFGFAIATALTEERARIVNLSGEDIAEQFRNSMC